MRTSNLLQPSRPVSLLLKRLIVGGYILAHCLLTFKTASAGALANGEAFASISFAENPSITSSLGLQFGYVTREGNGLHSETVSARDEIVSTNYKELATFAAFAASPPVSFSQAQGFVNPGIFATFTNDSDTPQTLQVSITYRYYLNVSTMCESESAIASCFFGFTFDREGSTGDVFQLNQSVTASDGAAMSLQGGNTVAQFYDLDPHTSLIFRNSGMIVTGRSFSDCVSPEPPSFMLSALGTLLLAMRNRVRLRGK